MARGRAYVPLNVFLNSRPVGVLRRQADGAIDFQYGRDWLEWPATFPVSMSLPLREDRYVGAAVVNVFDNLLPDSDPIRRRVAERVGADGTDAFSLLSALGQDCVGALQFLPDGTDPGSAGQTDGRPVSDHEIAEIIRNLAAAPLGMGKDDDFRISIAGAQEKTALLRKHDRWFRPTGTTATTHILKPRIGRLPNGVDLSDSVENEYLCLKLLEAFGVSTARAEIATFEDRRTLVVERFDRFWTTDGRLLRLPQEDTCQALSVPPTRKYQSDGGPGIREIVGLLKASDTPEADVATFLRACVLFWVLGATDGHAKNVSIFLGPGGRFRMTPFYDVLTAQPSLDSGRISHRTFKLAMSFGRNRRYAIHDIVPHHFMQTAELAGIGISALRAILDDIATNAVRQADSVIATLPDGFPEPLARSVMAAVSHRTRLISESLSERFDA